MMIPEGQLNRLIVEGILGLVHITQKEIYQLTGTIQGIQKFIDIMRMVW